ncbi:MAG: helix-turn-helix transcriptional regulator [Pseudomonadota bacterium]
MPGNSIPAEKVLPELADDTQRPATMLRSARYKAGMTQKELAGILEIHQHHLSEMEHGKRPIGKNMAKKLSEVLDCDYRVFL